MAARLATAVAIAVLAAGIAATVAPGRPTDDRVDVAAARSQPCTRQGVATSLMAFFGLMEERRFAPIRLLWLARPRLGYAYVLNVIANGKLLRTRVGADLPKLAEAWMASGGPRTEVVVIDPTISKRGPLNNGFGLAWVRQADDGSGLVLGSAKGVWDCERRQIARLVGSEQAFETEEGARAYAVNRCGRRGSTTIRRYGQTAALCKPHRAK